MATIEFSDSNSEVDWVTPEPMTLEPRRDDIAALVASCSLTL